MLLAILAVVTATFHPAAPTVGDRITVDFPAAVVLEASPAYEVMSQQGSRAVIRTFEPRPFELSGTVGGVPFRGLRVPVRSVLREKDDLKPSPLTPPLEAPMPRRPFVAMALMALAAAAAWLATFRLASRSRALAVPPLQAPAEVYRRAILSLRHDARHPLRWAAFADATRAFLAATRTQLGSDLTTTEIVPRLAEGEGFVAQVLRQGDLEKFSVRGPEPADFDALAARALDLATPAEAGPR